ncbi:hypothetical protein EYB53_024010 [Candidatus Chloroploca sp. M-50]|uniref:Phosphorylated adapter RNA export protein n=1 Tax=Candidatus Chloroploca mongolica TaxID=2528176 RepID=A0ABS4DH93_9CHLR|nr:phosphorylated adapter RNA export RNA-binding domain-containing protein [Candidatus Chloroploca mongolica]MBP1468797.1 hypothetical protein [Candidatus Chloroploca mongolica]
MPDRVAQLSLPHPSNGQSDASSVANDDAGLPVLPAEPGRPSSSAPAPAEESLPSPDDPSFGLAWGQVRSVYPKYAFARIPQFGLVFLHRSAWPEGVTTLEVGQYLTCEVRQQPRGFYGVAVQLRDAPPGPAREHLELESAPIGHALGIVEAVHASYAFLATRQFGSVFLHHSAWPAGITALEVGQVLTCAIHEQPRGFYGRAAAFFDDAMPPDEAAWVATLPPALQAPQRPRGGRFPSPDDSVLGAALGRVITVQPTYAFVRTRAFGAVFLHASAWPEGVTTFAVGQYLACEVRENARGRYGVAVRPLAWPLADAQVALLPPCAAEPIRRMTTPVDDRATVLAQIVTRMQETNPVAITRLGYLLDYLGPEQLEAFLVATEQIEAQGGLLVRDGSRRRTPGGVLFALLKEQLPPAARKIVFPYLLGRRSTKRPRAQSAARAEPTSDPLAAAVPPTPPPVEARPDPGVTWATRGEVVTEARQHEQGTVMNVKVTLTGRPEHVVERGKVVTLLLEHRGPVPALPKGVPVPEHVPTTSYLVYVSQKQWQPVAEALRNPELRMLIEGFPFWDAAINAIAVHTMMIKVIQPKAKAKAQDTAGGPTATEGAEAAPAADLRSFS